IGFVDVKSVINAELDVNSNVGVVLQLEKFFDDPCELLNKELRVVVEYDAPRFKCNYQINGSVDDKIRIDENYKTNYELKIINPEEDFYVSSKNPSVNFNGRNDLHVGNDDGILRTYIYSEISKINKTNLLKALLALNVMQIKGDSNELVFYELPNNFNPKNIKWNLQPKIGEKIETKLINNVGDFVIDITEYVKKGKGYGFSIRAYDESKNSDIIINSLESEQKPKIKLYYKSEKTLKEQCTIL
ncbi:MAG: DNRLRE domain-containing protein, partial [Candidatus Woesearchaeota archaeon]